METVSQKKPGILFFCAVGYLFQEVFQPIIEEMKGTCRAYVQVADSHMTESNKQVLSELQNEGAVENFHIIQPHFQKGSLIKYHRHLNALTRLLSDFPVDMIVTGSDGQIFDRYLLDCFSSSNIKKVVIQTGTVKYILQAYRKLIGADVAGETKRRRPDLLKPLRVLKKKKREWIVGFHQWRNYCLFPLRFRKKIFRRTGYEHFRFASGLCDHVICYDDLEREAMQTTNPLLKSVYLARHPQDRGGNEGECVSKTGRMLVTLSGNLGTEMSEEKINRWVRVTKKVAGAKNVQCIRLRFHPRLSPRLQWPEKMIKAIQCTGYAIETDDPEKTPLCASLLQCDGVLGGPSSTLRIARAVNKSMFVFGFSDGSDGDANDQPWILGSGEGVRWIDENAVMDPERMQPLPFISDDRPNVSTVLLNLLVHQKGTVSKR